MDWNCTRQRAELLILVDLSVKMQKSNHDVQIRLIFLDLRIFAVYQEKDVLKSVERQAVRNLL